MSSTNALVAGLNGVYPGNHAGIVAGMPAYYVQFADASGKASYGFVDLVCNVNVSGQLTCTDASGEGDNMLEFCSDLENHLLIANYQYDTTCVSVTLQTSPMSCTGVD